jgi:hypothetical protein
VSLLVARAQILPDEGAVAVGKVAVVDLLGVVCSVSVSCTHCLELASSLTIQLMPVQMLGARVALPTALVRALELLVQTLPAPPALAGARGIVAVAAVVVAAGVGGSAEAAPVSIFSGNWVCILPSSVGCPACMERICAVIAVGGGVRRAVVWC